MKSPTQKPPTINEHYTPHQHHQQPIRREDPYQRPLDVSIPAPNPSAYQPAEDYYLPPPQEQEPIYEIPPTHPHAYPTQMIPNGMSTHHQLVPPSVIQHKRSPPPPVPAHAKPPPPVPASIRSKTPDSVLSHDTATQWSHGSRDTVFEQIKQTIENSPDASVGYTSVVKSPKRTGPLRTSGTQTLPEPKEVQTDLPLRDSIDNAPAIIKNVSGMVYHDKYENQQTLNIAEMKNARIPPRPANDVIAKSLNSTQATHASSSANSSLLANDQKATSGHDWSVASDFQDYRASNEQLNVTASTPTGQSELSSNQKQVEFSFYNHEYEENADSLRKSTPEKVSKNDGRMFKLVVNQPVLNQERGRMIVRMEPPKTNPKSNSRPGHDRKNSSEIYNSAKPEPKPRQKSKERPKPKTKPKLPEKSPVTKARVKSPERKSPVKISKPKWKSPNDSIEIHEPTPKHMTEPANQSEQTMSYNEILAKHRQSPSYSPPKSIDQQILREQYAIAVRSGSTEPERPERTSPKKKYPANQIQESGNESDSRAARMRLKARERRSDHSDLDEIVKSNTKESF